MQGDVRVLLDVPQLPLGGLAVNEEALAVPEKPHRQRLGLPVRTHRDKPGQALLPQAPLCSRPELGTGVDQLRYFPLRSINSIR